MRSCAEPPTTLVIKRARRPFSGQVDWICKHWRTFEYVFFIGESVPHIGQLSVSCYSAAKASDSFGKIWEYFVMPTIVNTFVKCFDNPNVDGLAMHSSNRSAGTAWPVTEVN